MRWLRLWSNLDLAWGEILHFKRVILEQPYSGIAIFLNFIVESDQNREIINLYTIHRSKAGVVR